MYIFTYLCILPEISAYHLQLKCMGGHFFSGPSLHRESTTALSDIHFKIKINNFILPTSPIPYF